MKRAHNYLVSKGKSDSDVMKFKHQLYDLWFKLYRRSVFYELRLVKVVDSPYCRNFLWIIRLF